MRAKLTRRMHGIVGERELSNCVVVMRRPEKQACIYVHMECEVCSMRYKACSRDMYIHGVKPYLLMKCTFSTMQGRHCRMIMKSTQVLNPRRSDIDRH